jgi:hypothetical protein
VSAENPSKTALYLSECVRLLGTPYRWWAKGDEHGESASSDAAGGFRKVPNEADEHGSRFALDCSGGVTVPAFNVGGPDLRWSHHAAGLWKRQRAVKVPLPGDLACYGESDDAIEHVMTVLAVLHTGEIMVIGASGGGHDTTSLAKAREKNAKMKIKSSHLYRPDFRGFRAGLFHE